jgi:hypothetical protein
LLDLFESLSSFEDHMTDPEPIDPRDVRPGPIRHESLSTALLEQIRAVYEVIGPFLGTTLEQFEIRFMRDLTPETEVAVWCMIAAAWISYHERYLGDEEQPEEVEKKLIISISSGVEDVEALGVPVDVGRKLLACYDGLSEE